MYDAKDRRTKRQKLEDMAKQTASPNEAEVAKRKLSEIKAEEPKKEHKINFKFTYVPQDGSFVDVKLGEEGIWTFNFSKNVWEKHEI